MLSPKMQRTIRINENQVLMLAEKARHDHNYTGYLYKRSSDTNKWQLRWFILYQNLLFYSENESSVKPSGVIMLEGCYVERLITNTKNKESEKQFCFAITYRRENQRQYDLRAETETDGKAWMEVIRQASFNKLLLQKEELEQKHLHLLQIVESEKTAKWQYTQQCEELTSEIKKLRAELCSLKKEWRVVPSRRLEDLPEDSEEIKKIKKVQSFFRGWLCRRRWKQIVEEYIRSPHAESMRKRNSLVFRMVEAEEEYVEQLNLLVSCFLRPFKMAASSKKPPCSHEDVNSIFLNSETLLFLHQIFLKGLSARMESWPTLVLAEGLRIGFGDLFDMLLPMLSIYQEYVRNHHYSLQVLAECKQNQHFGAFLNRLENKPSLQGRTLETFLTYPMHQVPRYIITLHELLAHTPHNHVERKSLDHARLELEDLSRQMHDEVSETENIRKNLAIERMIVEGCDILLDVNQMFVRQGSLIQILGDHPSALTKTRLGHFKSEKEAVRQCFLFSNHFIMATRTSAGKLHLVSGVGKIALNDATLIEDPSEEFLHADDADSTVSLLSAQSSSASDSSVAANSDILGMGLNFNVEQANLDFKIVVEQKSGLPIVIHLVAPTMQEKQAWISDISHCLDNVHFNNFFRSSMSDTSSITMPHFIKNDPKLFRDDIDIRFSRTLNSCKVPHIRYATPERLLERLTDLRFLSIDFLNTFLLTYRVFSDGVTVLEALKKVYYNPECNEQNNDDSRDSSVERSPEYVSSPPPDTDSGLNSPRGSSSFSAFQADDDQSGQEEDAKRTLEDLANLSRENSQNAEDQQQSCDESDNVTISENITIPEKITISPTPPQKVEITKTSLHTEIIKEIINEESEDDSKKSTLTREPSQSEETEDLPEKANGNEVNGNQMGTPTDASDSTLEDDDDDSDSDSEWRLSLEIDRRNSRGRTNRRPSLLDNIPVSNLPENVHRLSLTQTMFPLEEQPQTEDASSDSEAEEAMDTLEVNTNNGTTPDPFNTNTTATSGGGFLMVDEGTTSGFSHSQWSKRLSGESEYSLLALGGLASPRSSIHTITPRSSFQVPDSPSHSVPRVGVVITSSRQSQRRCSSASAAAAFAVATAGSSNPRDITNVQPLDQFSLTDCRRASFRERPRQESIISTAATMRVLNVLRHWVSKHSQDFDTDSQLRALTIEFLDDMACSPSLLPAEHKAASQLLKLLAKEEPPETQVELSTLLAPPSTPSGKSIETLSALEVAEQMTYTDHQIFISIRSEEFLKTSWMKPDKEEKAPYILLITRRFNEVSRLVASEVIRASTLLSRIAVIEKWVAVADICRCLHNFNGVLQVCAAFQNTSVFRLKKTWERVSKTTRQTLEKLQALVSSDGRFRNLRDTLHRSDPPCIPYLGMYLTDLSFIEEGTPNFTDDGLLNFSKMRMIAHVIREIRHFQQTPYKIEYNPRVTSYLLDPSLLMSDDNLYRLSLDLEPRRSTLTNVTEPLLPTTATGTAATATTTNAFSSSSFSSLSSSTSSASSASSAGSSASSSSSSISLS